VVPQDEGLRNNGSGLRPAVKAAAITRWDAQSLNKRLLRYIFPLSCVTIKPQRTDSRASLPNSHTSLATGPSTRGRFRDVPSLRT
jgi:hypothetical protein